MKSFLRHVIYIPNTETDSLTSIIARFIRHLMVGSVGTVLYIIILSILVEIFKINAVVSSMFSFLILTIYSYLLSHLWVYHTSSDHVNSIPKYLVVTAVAFFLNTGIMYLFVEVLNWWYLLGIVGAIFIIPPTNFLLNYYWTFK